MIDTGEGNGNPFQCSCLQNPRDSGAWWAASVGLHRVGQDWSNLAAAAAKELKSSLVASLYTVKVKVTQSCPTLVTLYSPWNSPGQNTGVGSLSLLQGIFPTKGSNQGLLHCRQILSHLSHQGGPKSLVRTMNKYLRKLHQDWKRPKVNCGGDPGSASPASETTDSQTLRGERASLSPSAIRHLKTFKPENTFSLHSI